MAHHITKSLEAPKATSVLAAPFAVPNALKALDDLPDSANVRPAVASLAMGISPATFWRLVARGSIKTIKIGPRVTTINVGHLRRVLTEGVK